MEIGAPFNASDVTLLLPTENLPPSDSFWITGSSPAFQGCSSMVNLENSNVDMNPYFNNEGNGNEEDMDHPEKKRRLNIDQVRFLERSFEVENKLGPDRKIQLAREVGLQPRQVAIWFQNRRARYKSKQLEKDYDILKASYDKLKADYDTLFKLNQNLKNEVELLKKKLEKKEKSEPSNPIQVDEKKNVNPKVEDMNSAKSDVFDSESMESSHYTNVNHSSFLETANSRHDRSDFSQAEENNFSKSLMPLPCLPKIEDGCYNYPVETDNSVWFWPY